MDIKKNLPYLGEKQKEGSIFFSGRLIIRPDYKDITINGYLGKYECICLLLGIDIVNFWDLVKHEGTGHFLSLVDSINNEINFALQAGDLRPLERKESFKAKAYGQFGANASTMRTQPYFKVMTFILWAKKLGYKIPKEIEAIIRQDNQEPLTKTEAQELGRLKKEQKKWNDSIKAAFMLYPWLDELDHKITHKELEKKIFSFFPNISVKTIKERIWPAIPDNLKNTGGAKEQKK